MQNDILLEQFRSHSLVGYIILHNIGITQPSESNMTFELVMYC